MCPPIPAFSLFAFTTIAIAFHRTIDLICFSSALFPGYSGCCPGKIVFKKGVFVLKGRRAPFLCENEISVSNRCLVLS